MINKPKIVKEYNVVYDTYTWKVVNPLPLLGTTYTEITQWDAAYKYVLMKNYVESTKAV